VTRADEGRYGGHEGADDNYDGNNDEHEQGDERVLWGFQDPTPWFDTLLAQDEWCNWGRQLEYQEDHSKDNSDIQRLARNVVICIAQLSNFCALKLISKSGQSEMACSTCLVVVP